jgi:hypothetical protein
MDGRPLTHVDATLPGSAFEAASLAAADPRVSDRHASAVYRQLQAWPARGTAANTGALLVV